MRVFLALLPAYFFSIFYRSFLSVIAEPVMADLAVGPAALGRIGAAWFVAFAIMQFPVGYALDRFGARRTIAVLAGIGVIGAALFALARVEWHALVGMALIGIGCSPVFMGALVLFAKAVPVARFAGLSSLFVGFGSLGNLLGSAPLAEAAALFGWRQTMLALAALFGMAWLTAMLFVREPEREPAAIVAGPLDGIGRILRIRALWFLLPVTFASYAVLATARGLWVAPFMGDVHGLDNVGRGQVALWMAIAMVLSAFLIAAIEKRIGGPKNAALASTLAMAVLFGLLAIEGHRHGPMPAAVLFIAIGLVGFSYTMVMAHARAFFPPDLIGRGMTFMNFFFIAGVAVVQSVSGWLLEWRLAAAPPFAAYGAMHMIFALLLVASAAIYWRAPKAA
jgi:predicted MFS family arabinose efflux permease